MSSDRHEDLESRRHAAVDAVLESERRIRRALRHVDVEVKSLEEDLSAFHDIHGVEPSIHSFWVHRLAHFLGALYERRLTTWVKLLTTKAFQGEQGLPEWNCCYQVAECFSYYSQWDDAPSDSSLTPENIGRLIWPNPYTEKLCKARISVSPFPTCVAFQRWQLLHPGVITDWNSDLQCSVIPLQVVKTSIAALQEAGTCEADLYRIRGVLLKKQADEIGYFCGDWSKRHIRQRIEVFKDLVQFLFPEEEPEPNKSDSGDG